MRYVVIVMPLAERQARDINAWWQANRPDAADQFADDFARVVHSLEQNPSRGIRWAAEDANRRALITTRTKLIVLYRIRPRAGRVEILRIKRP